MEEPNLTQETSITTVDPPSSSSRLSTLWSTDDIETLQLAINLEARLTFDYGVQRIPNAEARRSAWRPLSEHELYPDVLEEKYSFEEADISEKQCLQEADTPEEEYSFQEADILEEKLNPKETDITEKCSHQEVDISEKNHSPQEVDISEVKCSRQKTDMQKHNLQASEEIKRVCSQQPELGGELGKPVPAFNLTVVDSNLVTWDGPDDPANPRNFPNSQKWRITMTMSLLNFMTPFASSIITPAGFAYSTEFSITNSTVASLTVSIFLLGYTIGPLFFAPLSELYGRLIVMHTTVTAFFAFTVCCALSQNTTQMVVFRFLSGVAGSAPLAIGAGILSDIWAPMELARAIAFFAMGPLLGPVTAPVVSSFIVEKMHWRWVLWILTIMAGVVCFIGFVFYRTETYPAVLLKHKAKRLRAKTGNPQLRTVFETTQGTGATLRIAIVRPFMLLLMNPAVFSLGLFQAFAYGFLYLMFVTFPELYLIHYHERIGIAGLNYLGPGIGLILGVIICTPLIQYSFERLTAANGGVSKPEFRLPVLIIGGAFVPVGLFWYGWSAEKGLHWVMPLVGTGIFSFGMISVFGAVQTYLIDMSPRYAASAVSAATVFRSLFGFGFPLFGQRLYDQFGYGWGNSILGFIAIPLGLIFPLMIYKYGEPWRLAAEARLDKSEMRKSVILPQYQQWSSSFVSL